MNRLIRLIEMAMRWLLARVSARKTWNMAVVRRYADANGAYVGELYLLGTFMGVLGYHMIGASLDTLPLDCKQADSFRLDTDNDFLAPMPPLTLRVGAQDPRDNDAVRRNVARLAREGRISLQIQNRFVEHILQGKRI